MKKFARQMENLEPFPAGAGFAEADIKRGEVVESEESRGDYLLLIREILTHVVRHPDAKDTADGIHKFWLSSKTVHQSSDKVREVLEYLVEKKGWLTKKISGASVTLYGLNKDRVHEVESFLQQVRNG